MSILISSRIINRFSTNPSYRWAGLESRGTSAPGSTGKPGRRVRPRRHPAMAGHRRRQPRRRGGRPGRRNGAMAAFCPQVSDEAGTRGRARPHCNRRHLGCAPHRSECIATAGQVKAQRIFGACQGTPMHFLCFIRVSVRLFRTKIPFLGRIFVSGIYHPRAQCTSHFRNWAAIVRVDTRILREIGTKFACAVRWPHGKGGREHADRIGRWSAPRRVTGTVLRMISPPNVQGIAPTMRSGWCSTIAPAGSSRW